MREAVEALPRPYALELVNAMRGVVDEGTGAAIRSRYGITASGAEFDIPRPRPVPRQEREREREPQWPRPEEIFRGILKEFFSVVE